MPSDRGHSVGEVAGPPRVADPRRMAEALSDPLRSDIFDALCGWLPNATVGQLAEFLGEEPGVVAREVAALEDSDLVEPLADAAAHPGDSVPYRATRDGYISDEEWAEFPADLRRRLLARTLDKMQERIRAAIGTGGFDSPDVHVSWLPTDLDGLGYQDMVTLLAETLNRARDIQVAAVQRRAEGSAEEAEIKTSLMIVHFLDGLGAPGEDRGAAPIVARMFELMETLADEVPSEAPDWHRIADSATALAALARRRASANVVR